MEIHPNANVDSTAPLGVSPNGEAPGTTSSGSYEEMMGKSQKARTILGPINMQDIFLLRQVHHVLINFMRSSN